MKISRIIWIFFVLYQVHDLSAQENLSLSEAIEIALQKNYDIRIEKLNTEVAKKNNSWGQAGRFPSISFDVTQNNSLRHTTNPASFLQGDVINNELQPSINLSWTLFDGMAVRVNKVRFTELERQAEGTTQAVIQNTVQAVMQAYYGAVLEQERLKIIQEALNLSRDKYDYLRLKRELGSAVTTEVLLEKSNYLTDSSRFVSQQVVLRNAVRKLNVLLVEDNPNLIRTLTDTLNGEAQEYDFEELRNKMIVENIDLKTLQFTQNVRQQEVKLRQADRLPQISLQATGNYNTARQDLTNAQFLDGRSGDVTSAQNTTLAMNFTFSLPLFNGGIIQRNIQNAVLQEKNGLLQIERQKQQLSQNLASALDLYNVRKQLLQIALQNRETAKTNLDLAEERFKTGLINSFDYRQLQNNFLNAAFAELEAIYNLSDTHINLLRLTGGILQEN